MIQLFLTQIDISAKKEPNDFMVLFLQGQMQLILFEMRSEEKSILIGSMQNLSFPKDLSEAEEKLRKSIEINPNFIECYNVLGKVLIRCNKCKEASEVLAKGLTVERMNKTDEAIAREMANRLSHLVV